MIIILFLYTTETSFAQKKKKRLYINSRSYIKEFTYKKDTLYNEKDTLIIIKDILITEKDSFLTRQSVFYKDQKKYFIKNDTTVFISDTVVSNRDTLILKNEKVLEHLYKFSTRNNIVSRALKSIVVFDDKQNSVPPKKTVQRGDRNYKAVNDKIIRDITITILDPFGSEYSGSDKKSVRILSKVGNFLHVNSYSSTIRNKLLFSKGDKINALKIFESERLLRSTGYIYDAKIIVHSLEKTDSVDLIVVIQDLWSISGSFVPSPTYSDFSLKENNFLGMGHQIQNAFRFDSRLPNGFNYAGNYSINNIYKTLSSGISYYHYEEGRNKYGIGINRDFITPLIKITGGINFYLTQLPLSNNLYQQDHWLGYAHNFNPKNWRKAGRLITAARYVGTHYSSRWNKNDLYLMSICYLNRHFYKDSYIFNLGRTEDIPTGNVTTLVFGKEFNSGGHRNYWGINGSWGRYTYWGYLYSNASLGGFKNKQQWESAVVSSKLLYFTPLFYFYKWKYRNYLGLRYTKGINQVPGMVVDINRENGLRGLNSNLLKSTEKFTINYEIDFFPPVNLLGFKMATMIFSDIGWINKKKKLISSENYFSGYGIGLRFQNEHLTFAMIQLIFAYYPKADRINVNEVQLFERTKYFYNYNNFDYAKPSLIPYN